MVMKVLQPGEAECLPPVPRSSCSSHLWSSLSTGLENSTPLPPRVRDLLIRPSTSSDTESGDPGCLSFQHRCIVNLAKTYLPVPPPPPPARKINPHKKYQYLLTARPDIVLEKSKRLGKDALAHYNRRKKIKFEMLDVMPVVQMPESGRLYTHINFTARSSKEGSKEQLFFAELYNCSKRRDPSGFLVTCCEPLGSDATVGHKGFQLDGSTVVRKNTDFARCFACGPRMLHPRGDKYIAGHCNVAHIYTNTC
ncbi:hypothetical protein SORBI_3005G206800 [Sorghum bicolor]|uniref:DUF3615 domain-containing protein n=2 Tax=Sorghum bicolor TaxID=4558 RepID=A0A1Z5RJM0_SORBI|nr:hypothetical protein SORBI_3005G206800 [Sorghum bicolor]